MKEYRRFLKVLFGIIVAGCLGIMILVIVVDPFFQYHKPLEGYPYVIEDQLSQNPGLARNTQYNAVLLGSSVTVNFSTDWFRDLFSVNLVKLPYNGAYPKDIANAMEQVDRSHNQVDTVFLAVDVTAYSADTQQIKYPLPDYLYDEWIFNDVSYWFNKDILLNYILKPIVDASQAADPADYYSTWQLFEYSREKTLLSYTPVECSEQTYETDFLIPGITANMDTNICPIIESHPDTKFIIFFPPASILFWNDFERLNQTDAILYNEAYIMERLFAYDNVEIYYFQNDFELITDLDNYMDLIHYSREVSYQMLLQMANGERKISEEDYQEVLEEMKAYLHGYDYESIWETQPEDAKDRIE